ncbi:MAG: hypothetical protein IPQ25_02930 [Chitinophagaceae bacterium]|nr:hypothetical protein [Chitinophagaceae bacterium]
MGVIIEQIEYFLPDQIITNDQLQTLHPQWDLQKVGEKSGVFQRHIAMANETAFDLACKAVEKVFASGIFQLQTFRE